MIIVFLHLVTNGCCTRTEDEAWVGVKKIKVCMGGDHGKGSYLFEAVALFRNADYSKEPCQLEAKLGEINESNDYMELLIPLLRRVSCGLSNVSIKNSVDCCMSLEK